MANLRSWATPITIGAFGLSAVTGVLMFFHLDTGLNKVAHEWLSWALVGGVALHVIANSRAFLGYLKRSRAVAVIGAFAVVLGLSFLPLAGEAGGSPVAAVMQGLAKAPVERVIALTGAELEDGLARLKAAGFEAEAGQSIGALSGGDRGQQAQILTAIFAE
ncbi:MAG: hypothetical protein R3D85_03315 [Paracoccaceae bacterium]